MSKKEWISIDEVDGHYEINRKGEIRLKKGLLIKRRGKGNMVFKNPKPLKTYIQNGYPAVNLSLKGKGKNFRVHRLLAKYFIPNPQGKPEINHIDFNKKNYSIENLEWCTRAENCWWSKKTSKKTSSKYKGVRYREDIKKYHASIFKNGKRFNLGVFTNEDEAALQYNNAVKEHFGRYGTLNIISNAQLNEKKVDG
jgi:hypothetical protein